MKDTKKKQKIASYQDWLNALIDDDFPAKPMRCPLCGASVGMYGPRRLLGCSSGYCESWDVHPEDNR